MYEKAGPHQFIFNGRLELSQFNEIFDTQLISENNLITIGGWLIEKIGDIRKSGNQYEFDGFLFKVLASDPNKIRKLYVRQLNPTPIKKIKKGKDKKNHSYLKNHNELYRFLVAVFQYLLHYFFGLILYARNGLCFF